MCCFKNGAALNIDCKLLKPKTMWSAVTRDRFCQPDLAGVETFGKFCFEDYVCRYD